MGIDHEQLPQELIDRAKDVMLRRINQARAALGRPTLAQLDECIPNHCDRCVLGHHLDVRAWRMDITCHDRDEAHLIADVWGTQARARGYSWEVALPEDLQVATAAFDAGQIPDLLSDDRGEWEPDIGEAIPADEVARALA